MYIVQLYILVKDIQWLTKEREGELNDGQMSIVRTEFFPACVSQATVKELAYNHHSEMVHIMSKVGLRSDKNKVAHAFHYKTAILAFTNS
jgi:hypothetical protein